MSNTHPRTSTWLGTLALTLGIGTVGAVTGLSARVEAASSAPLAAEQGRAEVAIEIPEVSCAGCSIKARKALKSAGGVSRIGEGDPKNRLIVTYVPGTGRPAVYVEALRKAGFPRAHQVAGR